jgi:hypothetical protein
MTARKVVTAATVGLFALSGIAQAQPLERMSLYRSVDSGVETVLARGLHWHTKPCVPARTAIAITQQPAHGTVRIVNEVAAVPKTTLRVRNTGYCAGMLLHGKKILYRSEPGFEGTDTMSYESIGSNGQRAPYTVTITVTAGS